MGLNIKREDSLAFLIDNDFEESWSYIPKYPNYKFSNKNKIFNIERNITYFYHKFNQRIFLYNNDNKREATLQSILIKAFNLKYGYIYFDEYFYKIPTFTKYAISNRNRVIKLESGYILKIKKDEKGYLYVDNVINDYNRRCKSSLKFLWKLYERNGRIYVINPETEEDESEMEYMSKNEYFLNIPNFPGYSVSNYGNVKKMKTNKY